MNNNIQDVVAYVFFS